MDKHPFYGRDSEPRTQFPNFEVPTMRFTSPKRSQTTVTAVHAVAPTFWSDDTTDAGSDESKPSTSAAPRLFAKKDLSEAPEPKVQPPQRLNLALAEAPGFAGGRDSPVSTSTSTTVWNRPVVPGSLKYTPLKNPVEVHVHPDDLRDNVFIGVVRALLKTGNVPAAPREISGFILKGNLALLGWGLMLDDAVNFGLANVGSTFLQWEHAVGDCVFEDFATLQTLRRVSTSAEADSWEMGWRRKSQAEVSWTTGSF